jgi:hypothetical protein
LQVRKYKKWKNKKYISLESAGSSGALKM